MLTHVVLFNFKETATPEQRAKLLQKGAEDLSKIPGVKNLIGGPNVREGSDFSHGLVMQFATRQELQAYIDHPLHMDLVNTIWSDTVASYTVFDLES